MMHGYFKTGKASSVAVFDLFFRENAHINYAVAAGLAQVTEYIKNLSFTKDDIIYLKSLNLFSDDFIEYLRGFKFTGDIFSVLEGEIVFPGEPIIIVKAPLIEAQLIETSLLNIVNHQTLIASKASRIVHAADPAAVIEFGLRRAQGPDAGIYGARAAMIGGCDGTSNVLSGKLFNLNVKGTHAHSFVMSYENELEAFRAFAKVYPDNCLLLVDTYDTLKSGVPNAITVFKELRDGGHRPVGVRLDSGDLAYLSKRTREMLDEAGFNDAIILASGDVDEDLIQELKLQGAKIDVYGVGTKLITSFDLPALGGVYKLSRITDGETARPVMKFSSSAFKMTNPGFKALYRIYDKDTGMALADLISLSGEDIKKPLILTHPLERWKTTVLDDYTIRPLLRAIFLNGTQVYEIPELSESIEFSKAEKALFWDEYKRLTLPHVYKVDLSDGLYELKQSLIKEQNK
jgi:nicotinate phosphoribosyltransferase